MKSIKFFLLSAALLASVSCGKNFGDINIDPNNPSQVPTDFLLTNAEKSIADLVGDEWFNARFGLLVAQYWSQNNYTDESRWSPRVETINGYWGAFYAGPLKDLQEIITLSEAATDAATPESKNRVAVAKVLQCWVYQFVTDVWGPVPYSEALQGATNRTPKFDAQKDIYLALAATLHAAIGSIDDSAGSYDGGDIIYGGEMAKWKAFASSLLLRVAMRMSDAQPDDAKREVEFAAATAFSGNADGAYFRYLTGDPNDNPLHRDRVARGNADFCISNILINNTLLPLNDPRLPAFADPTVNSGSFTGRAYGQSSANAAGEPPEDYSQPSGATAVSDGLAFGAHDVLAPEAPFTFMNYAEVCFILAEAKERGWNVPGTAAAWYEAGVNASLDEWGVGAGAATYLAQPAVAYATAAGDWKQKIGVQKWLALYMQGVQGWSEWRRLDFQKLEAPVDGSLNDIGTKVAPVRLTFPTNEQTQNATGYTSGVSALGGPDKFSSRVWWDVQ